VEKAISHFLMTLRRRVHPISLEKNTLKRGPKHHFRVWMMKTSDPMKIPVWKKRRLPNQKMP
jgi:hypothetical protein